MLDSWSMDGAGEKIKPWSTDEFFGEVRKLAGIAPEPKAAGARVRGLLVARTESIKAEHALGSYGVEYTVEDVDRDTLRIVSQDLGQAAGMLRHAKITFTEDIVKAEQPKADEPSGEERDGQEMLYLMDSALTLATKLGMNESFVKQFQQCIDDAHAELKARGG